MDVHKWNELLVEVLFPLGVSGHVRLNLTDDHIRQLIEKADGIDTAVELRLDLYEAVNAATISSSTKERIRDYQIAVKGLVPDAGSDNPLDSLEQQWVQLTPNFLAQLVVVVDAFIHGDNESSWDNDRYEPISKGIASVVGVGRHNVWSNLQGVDTSKVAWWVATKPRPYSLGNIQILDKKAGPWMVLKKWTENRRNRSSNGAMVLDTRGVKRVSHGYVRAIIYHAPMLSTDYVWLIDFGKEMRDTDVVFHSGSVILERLYEIRGNLTHRARVTLEDWKDKKANASVMVDVVSLGFHSPPEAPRTDSMGSAIPDLPPDDPRIPADSPADVHDTVWLESRLLNYGADGWMVQVRIRDVQSSDEEFALEISGVECRIPVDAEDGRLSEWLDLHIPDGTTLELSEIGKGIPLSRGQRSLKCDDKPFLRIYSYGFGPVWSEALPSNGAELAVLSTTGRAREWASKGGKCSELKLYPSPYILSGDRLELVKVIWGREESHSARSEFRLKSGSVSGPREYFMGAPPYLEYTGPEEPHKFRVTLNWQGTVVELDNDGNRWYIEPFRDEGVATIEEDLDKEPLDTQSIALVRPPDGSALTFLNGEYRREFEHPAINLEQSSTVPEEGAWESHRKGIEQNSAHASALATQGAAKRFKPLWLSFAGAKALWKALRLSPKSTDKIRGKVKVRITGGGDDKRGRGKSIGDRIPQLHGMAQPPPAQPRLRGIERLRNHVMKHPKDMCAKKVWLLYLEVTGRSDR